MLMKAWWPGVKSGKLIGIGNNEADAAADLGRRRVHHAVSDARRVFNRACARWYPVVCDLHRFFIAIARAALNEDGGAGT